MSYDSEQQAMRMGQLMVRQLQGILTEDEYRELAEWLTLSDKNRRVYNDFMDRHIRQTLLKAESPRSADEVLLSLLAKHRQQKATTQDPIRLKQSHSVRKWLAYAAALLLISSATFFFYVNNWDGSQQSTVLDAGKILAGGNKATLTLADGRTIALDDTKEGIVIKNNNILYNDESGEVAQVDAQKPEPLMLTTPKGGVYQLTLPDGSYVWLNAASTLKYPSHFEQHSRVVEISGEAYFSIKADKSRPFQVISNGQIIEVLGTEFNIDAYPDEHITRTTLVEGRIQVATDDRQGTILKPGEQAISEAGKITVEDVEVDPHIAWIQGIFYFKKSPLKAVLGQLARWYDVQVVYEGEIPQTNVFGELDRKLPLGTVLKLLERGGLQCRVVKSADVNQLVVSSKQRSLVNDK